MRRISLVRQFQRRGRGVGVEGGGLLTRLASKRHSKEEEEEEEEEESFINEEASQLAGASETV